MTLWTRTKLLSHIIATEEIPDFFKQVGIGAWIVACWIGAKAMAGCGWLWGKIKGLWGMAKEYLGEIIYGK